MEAAKRFFCQAVAVVAHAPERVAPDGHDSSPPAIRETIGNEVVHQSNASLTHRVEQDHRGIKQRYYPMRGFGSVASAAHFCRAFDARAPVLPGPDHDEATGFPCPPTRGVPPPIGRVCWPWCWWLNTQKNRAPAGSTASCWPGVSVLTRPC
jgi:hypothetical protein